MSTKEKIKILLVDDHKLIREGIKVMLGTTSEIEIIDSVASGEEAINSVRENKPDLILMDIMMGGMIGIEATWWIKEYDATINIILLTQEISKEYVSAGIKSGIQG